MGDVTMPLCGKVCCP